MNSLDSRSVPLTWMIVEDDAATLDALATTLQLYGCPVLPFNCGRAVLEYLDSNTPAEIVPQVALIDIRLPDVPGPQISAALRQHAALGEIGIMLMTAFRLDPVEKAHIMQQSGADALIYKPLPQIDQLLAQAEGIVKRRAGAAERPH
jgi:DNA-binding response OmpR family regulator